MVGLSKMIMEKIITAGTIGAIDIMSMVIHAFIQSLASLTDIDQPTESTLNTMMYSSDHRDFEYYKFSW